MDFLYQRGIVIQKPQTKPSRTDLPVGQFLQNRNQKGEAFFYQRRIGDRTKLLIRKVLWGITDLLQGTGKIF